MAVCDLRAHPDRIYGLRVSPDRSPRGKQRLPGSGSAASLTPIRDWQSRAFNRMICTSIKTRRSFQTGKAAAKLRCPAIRNIGNGGQNAREMLCCPKSIRHPVQAALQCVTKSARHVPAWLQIVNGTPRRLPGKSGLSGCLAQLARINPAYQSKRITLRSFRALPSATLQPWPGGGQYRTPL